jgi:hypothetical protein
MGSEADPEAVLQVEECAGDRGDVDTLAAEDGVFDISKSQLRRAQRIMRRLRKAYREDGMD